MKNCFETDLACINKNQANFLIWPDFRLYIFESDICKKTNICLSVIASSKEVVFYPVFGLSVCLFVC